MAEKDFDFGNYVIQLSKLVTCNRISNLRSQYASNLWADCQNYFKS